MSLPTKINTRKWILPVVPMYTILILILYVAFEISTVATAFAAPNGLTRLNTMQQIRQQQQHRHHHHQFRTGSIQHKPRSIRIVRSSDHQSSSLNALPAFLSGLRGGGTTSAYVTQVTSLFQHGTATPQSLFNSIFASLVVLTVVSKVIQRASIYNSNKGTVIAKKPASVVSLQRRFLAVFWLLRCSDWLQGPYFYEVYASKLINGVAPASMALISRLFLTGFASTALFGPAVGKAADQYGRKKATIAFTVIYAIGALSTKSTLLQVLFLGRILSGIGTSLLFSAPESWLVGEAQKKTVNEKGEEVDNTSYLGDTFGLAYAGDSIVAITAGQMAGVAANRRGPTGPFELSTIFLGLGALLTALLWKENKGEKSAASTDNSSTSKPKTSTTEAIEICLNDPKILLVGAVQSLFEAAMYIFVLQWPPAIAKAIQGSFPASVSSVIPYGTIFSCFMACCLLGSTVFGQFARMNVPVESFTSSFLAMATIAMTTSTWTIFQPTTVLSLPLLVISFFLFEAAVGMYFPSIGTLRSRFVPDSHRSLIMNLFGIPLNVLVVSVFLSIHKLGVGGALSISSGALALATLCMIQLQRIAPKEEKQTVAPQ